MTSPTGSRTIHLFMLPNPDAITKLGFNNTCWISDYRENKLAIDALVSKDGCTSPPLTITVFTPQGEQPADQLASVWNDIEDHHGEYTQDEPYDEIIIYNLEFSSDIIDIADEFGFSAVPVGESIVLAQRFP
ncbi:MAG: hypothetical protein JW829_11105 [Pirellulales bacterium]|nr:hypothetical protein [Pirellulales bacterium]